MKQKLNNIKILIRDYSKFILIPISLIFGNTFYNNMHGHFLIIRCLTGGIIFIVLSCILEIKIKKYLNPSKYCLSDNDFIFIETKLFELGEKIPSLKITKEENMIVIRSTAENKISIQLIYHQDGILFSYKPGEFEQVNFTSWEHKNEYFKSFFENIKIVLTNEKFFKDKKELDNFNKIIFGNI